MNHPFKLKNTDMSLDSMLMGTWQADSKRWPDSTESGFIATLQAAFEGGLRWFDTAEVYGDGYSEQLIAKALGGRRQSIHIASKVFVNHLQYDQVMAACERSLGNLKTDYIDLYQIHWPAGSFATKKVPIEETMRALNELQQQGKIRAIGVSNFSKEQLAAAAEHGNVVSNQIPYSLFWRYADVELRPYCIEQDIAILAYSSLAQGLLTGKFKPGHKFDQYDSRCSNFLFQADSFARAMQAMQQLQPIADRLQMSLSELAIAWVYHQTNVFAIVGASRPEQAVQNAKAAHCTLSEADVTEISEIGMHVASDFMDQSFLWDPEFAKRVKAQQMQAKEE